MEGCRWAKLLVVLLVFAAAATAYAHDDAASLTAEDVLLAVDGGVMTEGERLSLIQEEGRRGGTMTSSSHFSLKPKPSSAQASKKATKVAKAAKKKAGKKVIKRLLKRSSKKLTKKSGSSGFMIKCIKPGSTAKVKSAIHKAAMSAKIDATSAIKSAAKKGAKKANKKSGRRAISNSLSTSLRVAINSNAAGHDEETDDALSLIQEEGRRGGAMTSSSLFSIKPKTAKSAHTKMKSSKKLKASGAMKCFGPTTVGQLVCNQVSGSGTPTKIRHKKRKKTHAIRRRRPVTKKGNVKRMGRRGMKKYPVGNIKFTSSNNRAGNHETSLLLMQLSDKSRLKRGDMARQKTDEEFDDAELLIEATETGRRGCTCPTGSFALSTSSNHSGNDESLLLLQEAEDASSKARLAAPKPKGKNVKKAVKKAKKEASKKPTTKVSTCPPCKALKHKSSAKKTAKKVAKKEGKKAKKKIDKKAKQLIKKSSVQSDFGKGIYYTCGKTTLKCRASVSKLKPMKPKKRRPRSRDIKGVTGYMDSQNQGGNDEELVDTYELIEATETGRRCSCSADGSVPFVMHSNVSGNDEELSLLEQGEGALPPKAKKKPASKKPASKPASQKVKTKGKSSCPPCMLPRRQKTKKGAKKAAKKTEKTVVKKANAKMAAAAKLALTYMSFKGCTLTKKKPLKPTKTLKRMKKVKKVKHLTKFSKFKKKLKKMKPPAKLGKKPKTKA